MNRSRKTGDDTVPSNWHADRPCVGSHPSVLPSFTKDRPRKTGDAEPSYGQADRVEAYWHDDDSWHPARVLKVKGKGVFLIRFDGFTEKHEVSSFDLRTPVEFEEEEQEDDEEEDAQEEETEEAVDNHPVLLPELLQRIKRGATTVELTDRHYFNEGGCRILARALSQNTCIASLDLCGTTIGSGASLLFPALAHLTSMTYLNLNKTDLQSSGASHLCSAFSRLTAMTELRLRENQLAADDGARICGAAAAAGMTCLKVLDLARNDLTGSSVIGCGMWRRLNLPQPPHDVFDEFEIADFSALTQFLISNME